MEVCGAVPGAGPGRAVAEVAVVADELDGGGEVVGGTGAGVCARSGPAEVVGEPTGRGVPDRLRWPVGGDQVDGGPVAMGVVAGFAGGADAQVIPPQDPEDVAVEASVDRARPAAEECPGR